jgi:hypothetical protein
MDELKELLLKCSRDKDYSLLPLLYERIKAAKQIDLRITGKFWAREVSQEERFAFGQIADKQKLSHFISRFTEEEK